MVVVCEKAGAAAMSSSAKKAFVADSVRVDLLPEPVRLVRGALSIVYSDDKSVLLSCL
jgi:hypothetical protein